MRILISPAKTMSAGPSTEEMTMPQHLEMTAQILAWLREQTPDTLQKLWKCSDAILQENLLRIRRTRLDDGLTPAITCYEGSVYRHIEPQTLTEEQMTYLQEHLRILSAFYGVLRPLDGITPYRMEMQTKARICGSTDLYRFWGSRLYEAVRDDSGILINLASKEYAKCVSDYLTGDDRMITCTFGETAADGYVVKATYAKMARGEMVRFMADQKVTDPEQIREFDRIGYSFSQEHSSDTEFVFLCAPRP